MIDRNLARGVFLIGISLAFGITATHYPIGDFTRAGPGLFPLMVSSLLFLVGLSTVIRSRFTEKEPLTFNFKNIGLILGSLALFAFVSEKVNMMAGITVMVFVAGIAASTYSVARNIKLAIGLILVALAFWKLLGLQLPLY